MLTSTYPTIRNQSPYITKHQPHRDTHIEGKLSTERVDHLILGIILHEVYTTSDVLVCPRGNKLQGELGAGRGDTIDTSVVRSIKGTVGRTSGWVRAQGSVPGATSVAVGVLVCRGSVEPTPVAVEHNLGGLGCAPAARAL